MFLRTYLWETCSNNELQRIWVLKKKVKSFILCCCDSDEEEDVSQPEGEAVRHQSRAAASVSWSEGINEGLHAARYQFCERASWEAGQY